MLCMVSSICLSILTHLSQDGKYYLLDFSRTMPPVKPDKRHKNGHLYHLFRREFLLSYSGKSLCPDAYSGFVILDERRKEYAKENDDATDVLLNVVIPKCVVELDKVCLVTPPSLSPSLPPFLILSTKIDCF